ncbi:unnamed protein product [Euphydryas editha]|uniref:PRA1 family protein n=1 Tax=Euphydryas editha TaxID=104508 RepID=A0AAU9U2Z8_EUPED|nr:unnamed protein product [Euphydryas editha]
MESIKTEPKLQKMVMCGDHLSVTKTELNLKEMKLVESKDKDRKIPASYARISPTSSRTEKPTELQAERARSRPASEHALLALRAGRLRRAASCARADAPADCGNRELLQAALVSFRWPPYLVVSWLLVLAAAHALHALAAALAAALPALRKLCQYFRLLTEESWHAGGAGRARPALLAVATALLYSLLGALLAAHALLRWAVEPLGADADDAPGGGQLTRVTDYLDDFDEKTDTAK